MRQEQLKSYFDPFREKWLMKALRAWLDQQGLKIYVSLSGVIRNVEREFKCLPEESWP